MKFPRRLATVCIAFLGILSLALPQLTAASAPFLQNLQLRDTGDDITRLQQFLNAQEYLVAQSGPGSRGNETLTFGLHTYQALTQFQSAHGLPTTGFFGPLTRALVATLVASSTATSTTAVPQSPAAPAFSTLSSTTSGYIPGVTPLPGYKPGQLIFIGGGSATPAPTPPASAPPAPYVAKAVHFDGSTYLYINPLVVSDSPVLSASMWIKTSLLKTNGLFDFDPNNNAAPDLSIDNNHNAFNFYENQNGGIFFGDTKADSFTPDGRWHHILFFVDTNHAGADKIVQMYLDDQPLNFSGGSQSLAAFSMLMANLDFAVPDTPADFGTPLFTGHIADVYIAPGQFIDFSVEANRRKFISADGKPVDLGSNCSTPTGTAPAVCFSGNASSFGTNKGTGGAFTLTGTLTDAVTSPSN